MATEEIKTVVKSLEALAKKEKLKVFAESAIELISQSNLSKAKVHGFAKNVADFPVFATHVYTCEVKTFKSSYTAQELKTLAELWIAHFDAVEKLEQFRALPKADETKPAITIKPEDLLKAMED